MSSIGSNDQERFHSDLLKRQGRALSLEALLTLDQEAVRWEREKETEIAEKAKYIEHLERDLESTKDKLKRLVESRFKSVERELAMSDSKLAETYDTLIGEIKTLVLNLTKKLDKVDGSVKNLLHLMGQSKQYQKRLQNILEPNVSTQQFVGLLEQSKTPTKLLAFVLRAIVMNMLRLKLFNSNVFLCVGGKNWKQLRGVYRHLLSAGE
ncbi:hypothetical protein ABW20_dc0100188 [Dactylellina cionopaga]|nr:hypothetical protein ABW20_dc0100188 [Dactylellina cionopaga]